MKLRISRVTMFALSLALLVSACAPATEEPGEAAPSPEETPVAMLKPGHGQTHRAYLWTYCTTRFNPVQAVVFDFTESRSGQHDRDFLGLSGQRERAPWKHRLVVDDFSGYKACFELGVTEVGCLAHARRKFHELWVNHGSTIAEQALNFYATLYDIEREVLDLEPDVRREIRQRRARPIADALQQWLLAQRQKVPDGSGWNPTPCSAT